MPPAFVTAAASLGPAATFMPARRMGWLMPKRSVIGVRICSAERASGQHFVVIFFIFSRLLFPRNAHRRASCLPHGRVACVVACAIGGLGNGE